MPCFPSSSSHGPTQKEGTWEIESTMCLEEGRDDKDVSKYLVYKYGFTYTDVREKRQFEPKPVNCNTIPWNKRSVRNLISHSHSLQFVKTEQTFIFKVQRCLY